MTVIHNGVVPNKIWKLDICTANSTFCGTVRAYICGDIFTTEWMAGIGPTASNLWKQSLKILTGTTKKMHPSYCSLIFFFLFFFFNSMYDWAFSHIASLLSSVKWIFLLSILLQVHSLFQSKKPTEYDLMLPLSISNILSFIYVHPVAAYVFLLVFLSPVFFFLSVSFNQKCV